MKKNNNSPWKKVKISRHPMRPRTLDYIKIIFKDFQEISGDRRYKNDHSIIGGPAFLDNSPVMILGTQKGNNMSENIKRNFGCPSPSGYKKALRIMKLSSKFKLPLIVFVDTPGACPGISSENHHISEAISRNIYEMFKLKNPSVSIFIGEGGSGGALAISVTDRILMLENAYYSVISPEGCSSILWRSKNYFREAASSLCLTTKELKKFGIIDKIIKEPNNGVHENLQETSQNIKVELKRIIRILQKMKESDLIFEREKKYRII
jgi:acetyl-CoA carboxylase carboxyl transferase subunit alpha